MSNAHTSDKIQIVLTQTDRAKFVGQNLVYAASIGKLQMSRPKFNILQLSHFIFHVVKNIDSRVWE